LVFEKQVLGRVFLFAFAFQRDRSDQNKQKIPLTFYLQQPRTTLENTLATALPWQPPTTP